MARNLNLAALLVAISLIVAACGGADSSDSSGASPTKEASPQAPLVLSATRDKFAEQNAAGTEVPSGWSAKYFNNMTLSGAPVLTRTDKDIDFQWWGSPGAGVQGNQFSVRWEGQAQPNYTEQYTFHVTGDDGVRLYVNNVLVVNDWSDHSARERTGKVNLNATQKYDIRVEFYNNWGGSKVQLAWSSASQTRQIVPTSSLTNTPPPPQPNKPPVISVVSAFSVEQGQSRTTSLSATDPDGDAISLSFSGLPSTTFSSNGGTGSLVTSVGATAQPGIYTGSLVATDSKGSSTISVITLTITAAPAVSINNAPAIQGSTAFSVEQGQSRTINISATDADGDSVTLAFSGLPSTTFSASGGSGVIVANVSLSATPGTFTGTLTATDSRGAKSTMSIAMIIEPVATPAGPAGRLEVRDDQIINEYALSKGFYLFDEPTSLALDANGDPIQSKTPQRDCGGWSAGASGRTCWDASYTTFPKSMGTLVIDFERKVKITDVYLFGKVTNMNLFTGSAFNFPNKLSYVSGPSLTTGGDWQNKWYRFKVQVPVESQFLRIEKPSGSGDVFEMAFVGSAQGVAPTQPTAQRMKVPYEQFAGVNGISTFAGTFREQPAMASAVGALFRDFSEWQYLSDASRNNIFKLKTADAQAKLEFFKQIKQAGGVPYIAIQGTHPSLHSTKLAHMDTKPIPSSLCAPCGENTSITENPATYLQHAIMMRDMAAALSADAKLVEHFEGWNEPDKTWKTREEHFRPYELAAMISADYDGHAGSLRDAAGNSVGIKNGSASAKMVQAALYNTTNMKEYIRAMIYWFQHKRADGKIPIDVLSYHIYSTSVGGQNFDGGASTGLNPESAQFRQLNLSMTRLRDRYLPAAETWNTEYGYDIDNVCGNSPYRVLNLYGNTKKNKEQVQAEWLARSSLELAAANVDRTAIFWLSDDNNVDTTCGGFNTSGLVETTRLYQNAQDPTWLTGFSHNVKKTSWYYMSTLKNRLAGMKYHSDKSSTDSSQPDVRIMKFKKETGTGGAYIVWSPKATGAAPKPYSLTLDITAGSAQLIQLEDTYQTGLAGAMLNSVKTITVNVSERPVLVIVDQL